MYRTKIRDIIDLSQKITDAIAIVVEVILKRTWCEIDYLLYVLRATNHIETRGVLNMTKMVPI